MLHAISRAALAVVLAALVTLPVSGAALTPPPLPAAEPAPEDWRIARLDLSEWADEFDAMMATHVPTPAAATGIGPGSHLLIRMAGGLYGCTASFLFTGSNGKTYLGSAGHCFLPEGRKATHGPGADYNPAGTTVTVCVSGCNFGGQMGFFISGSLVTLGSVAYARQATGGSQIGHDFGVVEVPASLHHLLRPAMPVFGGPSTSGSMGIGTLVCHFGNGVGVGEVYPTHGRVGVGFGESTITPSWRAFLAAAPGDSGSAAQSCERDADGIHGVAALGTLTHISSGFIVGTTMPRSLEMAKQAGLTLTLVTA